MAIIANVLTVGLCEGPGCTQRAVTSLTGDATTLRWLGFQTTESLGARVCAGCYLRAMAEVLKRAGLPKAEPPKVVYFCAECNKAIEPLDMKFGPRGVSPHHELPGLMGLPLGSVPSTPITHPVKIQVVK